ncbi:MAG: YggT family protein [Mesorhizobium sp.]|uniref:YggT family protein n=2 Tax=Mesorhizobium TaxID=68287 RepID=UPI000F74C913|nr:MULTISPECIES: YggT family protein [unclassified Mesorhizobium]RVD72093.1 YggT family protein [Mesorhizobium sp. M4A.F.Ca.ET.029.04.2.1]AZO50104.1 YggT family protein [Mesorhizobium sp. M4B.F.Ca.ET.058.02.1.1]RWC33863.1 MAG: YggT family protein [Mesorhizobium sp.]RWD06271.1 MAG: YggT family protein [Mesorhizobium sp.]RWD11489.1 MAG: YggT family protein [Mesorhizobium sp.]
MAHLSGAAVSCQGETSGAIGAAGKPALAGSACNGYMSAVRKEHLMIAVFYTLHAAIGIYWWIVIGAAIFSWLYAFNVVNSRNQLVNSIGTMLYRLTEPALRPIRRFLPDLGGVDISPIILLLALTFISVFLNYTVQPMFGIGPM